MRKIQFLTLITGLLISLVTFAKQQNWPLKYGKYSCTSSKYINGSFQFNPKGTFTITEDKKYVYNGFQKPSVGTYTVDKSGNLLFKGGYFDGGKAEKTDRENKFLLVFPANPDNRWTSTFIK